MCHRHGKLALQQELELFCSQIKLNNGKEAGLARSCSCLCSGLEVLRVCTVRVLPPTWELSGDAFRALKPLANSGV